MAKKKMKAREIRELYEQKRKEKYSKVSNNVKPEKTAVKAPEPAPDKTVKLKSAAKAVGLKSSFVLGEDLVLTSFGRGNEAVPELRLIKDGVEKIKEGSSSFELSKSSSYVFTLHNIPRNITARPSDPRHLKKSKSNFKEDQIGIRKRLEKRVFGKNFDDNIHVQLAYNILDIEKIMIQYIVDIVYVLHNVNKEHRNINKEHIEDDLLGYLSVRNSYKQFKNYKEMHGIKLQTRLKKQNEELTGIIKSGRLGYFGSAFIRNEKQKDEKEIYHIYALMGSLRQSYFHGDKYTSDHQGPEWAYCLEKKLPKEYKETLNRLYEEGLSKVNKDFGFTNRVNLQILETLLEMLYGKIDPKTLAGEYYDFIVSKDHKYLGFSIKKLREKMLDETALKEYRSDDYNSVRQKLYKVIDFLIYNRYVSHDTQRINDLVDKLRASRNDDEKDKIYAEEAVYTFSVLEKALGNELEESISGDKIRELDKETNRDFAKKNWDVSDKMQGKDVNLFCKLIYMMTLLLDGKEINDLLTTLVSKFDNIASFIDVLKELGLDCGFESEYEMFRNSKKICSDLKIINSFARMSSADEKSKRQLFRDALVILGMDQSEEYINDYLDNNAFLIDENGHIKESKDKHDFRNFIANSVIKSSRFKYLVKYSSADGLRKLKKNKKLISFVLKSLPDTQIDRYYESCKLDSAIADRNVKINKLADLIGQMDFNTFIEVKNSNESTPKEKQDKSKYQAMISLYLMVLYQIVKNMIYVNSRYVIAFHCLERDRILCGKDKLNENNYNELTEEFIEKKYNNSDAQGCNKRAGKYLKQNISHCSDDLKVKLRVEYRNSVAHFEVIREIHNYSADIGKFDSWFELYHYIMQRSLRSKFNDEDPHEKEYKQLIDKHHTYCKDLVKALNTPFGYNLPRYKNLSICELFDRNNYNKNTAESIRILDKEDQT